LTELDGVDPAVRSQVVWFGFRDLTEAIREVGSDPVRLLSEQTRFLLGELVALYEAEGLTTNDDTVVVAARDAWPLYQQVPAYICQQDRGFRRGLTHLGFYAGGAIQALVPQILAYHPAVTFTAAAAASYNATEPALAALVELVLSRQLRDEGSTQGVMLLSGPGDAATVRLAAPIQNDTTTQAGRKWAWTLGQRYVRLERLRSGVTVTSALQPGP